MGNAIIILSLVLGLAPGLSAQEGDSLTAPPTLPAQDSAAVDSVAADSVVADTSTADSTAKDSLRAGKRDTGDAVQPAGKNGWGISFAFMIPIIDEFQKLRSPEENSTERLGMLEDVEERFDNNEISFPLELFIKRRLNSVVEGRLGAAFFHISNANRWTPRDGDTVFTRPHVNSYKITVAQVSLAVRLNISPKVITVTKFDRFYLGFSGVYYPYLKLQTERTLLNTKIDSRGRGSGVQILIGTERYLNPKTFFRGEILYGISRWKNFTDGDEIKNEDIRVGGDDSPFEITVRQLQFKFSYGWWF